MLFSFILSLETMQEIEITQCNKIDKPIAVYIFSNVKEWSLATVHYDKN